jgi:phage gpG-like protein
VRATTAFLVDHDRAGWRRARRRIRELATRAEDVRPAWGAFLDWFALGNRQQFGSRGARWKTPWKELALETIWEKRYLGYQTDILVRTSDLLRSVADRPLNVERLHAREMTAGTAVKYAGVHHRGAQIRRTVVTSRGKSVTYDIRIPARPLWNARVIRVSGAATSAVRTWIVNGNPRVHERIVP